ncbi:unnamed protein product [Aphanomyces euteiches]
MRKHQRSIRLLNLAWQNSKNMKSPRFMPLAFFNLLCPMRFIATVVAALCLVAMAAEPNCNRPGCTGCDYDWEFRRCECISCSASPTVVVPVTPPPSSVSPPVTAAPGPKSCGRDSCGLCYKLLATPLTTLRLE